MIEVSSGPIGSPAAARAIGVRHDVYCLGHLLPRCPVSRPTDPHDDADADPGTIHFVVARDGCPVGSMRLIPNMDQGSRLWGGWPEQLRGHAWEASRVSLLPDQRGNPELLRRLLRAAGSESLERGCDTWIAAVSDNLLRALSRLGLSLELLNDARPIDYSKASGIQTPVDGRTMVPAVIRVAQTLRSWQ